MNFRMTFTSQEYFLLKRLVHELAAEIRNQDYSQGYDFTPALTFNLAEQSDLTAIEAKFSMLKSLDA